MKYNAILIDESLRLGRCSGKLNLYHGEAVFEGENILRRLSLADTEVVRGGAANRLIFLNPKSHNNFSIYTEEKKILKDINLSQIIVSKHVSDSIFSGSLASLAIITLVVIALFISFLAYARQPFVTWVASKIPVEAEQKLGALAWESIKAESAGMIEDSLLNETLQEAVKPLVDGMGKTRFPLKFHISRDSLVNAFAIPGGYMVINAGLIHKADSLEEILGVVAHEIAHVEKQHSMRQIINTIGIVVLAQTLLGDFSGVIALVAQQGAFLLQQSYSREYETEADQVGLKYLEQSRIAPGGLVTFFEKIKAIQDKSELKEVMDSEIFEYFSTHPSTDDRIKYLSEDIKKIDEPSDGWIKNENALAKLKARLIAIK